MHQRRLFFIFLLITFILSCSDSDSEKNYIGVVEGTTVNVPALTGGKINEILVDTGDEVARNQILARIDTIEISFQKQQLQANLEEVEIRESVAKTNLNRANNDYQYMKQKVDRFRKLRQTETVPQQSLDDLENKLNSAKSAYQAANQQLKSVQAAKKQLRAQMGIVEKKLNDATVTSPAKGVISDKYFEPGEAVSPLSPILELISLDEVWVKIYLSETILPKIKIGQKVNIHPDGIHEILDGVINWVSPKAEFTPKSILTEETRTSLVYAVKVSIDNQQRILKEGMPVEVTLHIEPEHN